MPSRSLVASRGRASVVVVASVELLAGRAEEVALVVRTIVVSEASGVDVEGEGVVAGAADALEVDAVSVDEAAARRRIVCILGMTCHAPFSGFRTPAPRRLTSIVRQATTEERTADETGKMEEQHHDDTEGTKWPADRQAIAFAAGRRDPAREGVGRREKDRCAPGTEWPNGTGRACLRPSGADGRKETGDGGKGRLLATMCRRHSPKGEHQEEPRG